MPQYSRPNLKFYSSALIPVVDANIRETDENGNNSLELKYLNDKYIHRSELRL